MITTGVTFRSADHTYWTGSIRRPSVSEVLRWGGAVPEDVYRDPTVRTALLRGRRVHRLTEQYDTETGATITDEDDRGYLEAWIRFVTYTRPRFSHIETPLVHALYGYAGTLDRAGHLFGPFVKATAVVIDIKTGSKRPWHALQLAAYAALVQQAIPITWERYGVYLSPTGHFTVHPYTNPSDFDRFREIALDWQEAYGPANSIDDGIECPVPDTGGVDVADD